MYYTLLNLCLQTFYVFCMFWGFLLLFKCYVTCSEPCSCFLFVYDWITAWLCHCKPVWDIIPALHKWHWKSVSSRIVFKSFFFSHSHSHILCFFFTATSLTTSVIATKTMGILSLDTISQNNETVLSLDFSVNHFKLEVFHRKQLGFFASY